MSTSQKQAGSNRRNFTCRWTRKYWPMYNCINVAPPYWHPPSQLLMITLYYDKNHHRPQQQLSNEHFIKAFSLITSLKFVIRWHCRINPSSPRAVIRCDYTPQTHCISVQIIAITAVMENTSVFVLLRACKKPGTINQLEIRTLTRHFSLEKKAALCIFQPHKGWLFPVLSFKVIKFKSLI